MNRYALVGIICSIALCSCGTETEQQESVLYTDIDCPSTVSTIISVGLKENVFNNSEEFNAYYYQLTGKTIDNVGDDFFDQYEIIAVEQGEGLTPSHRLDIIGFYDEGENSLVKVQLEEPGTCPVDGVERNPYCIIAVPKLNKPVEFSYSTVKKCNPNIE